MRKIILIFTLIFLTNQFQLIAELHLIGITEPGNFKADTGRFSDAYYVMTEAPVEVKALVYNDSNIDITNAKARVRIYQEGDKDCFKKSTYLEKQITISVEAKDTIEISFNLENGDGEKFFPETYENLLLRDKSVIYPNHFQTMLKNVTPRYKIIVDIYNEVSIEKLVRFFVKKSPKNWLISAENCWISLNSNSTSDQIAGKLNFDSLYIMLFRAHAIEYINYNDGILKRVDSNWIEKHVDILDRTLWEVNCTSYLGYKRVFWSDGDDKPINKNERKALSEFYKLSERKNLNQIFLCSQEIAREHDKNNEFNDIDFLKNFLKAENIDSGFVPEEFKSHDTLKLIGEVIARRDTMCIIPTKFPGDKEPKCAFINALALPFVNVFGWPSLTYLMDTLKTKKRGIGTICGSKDTVSCIFIGADWRHLVEIQEYYWEFEYFWMDKYTDLYIDPWDYAHFSIKTKFISPDSLLITLGGYHYTNQSEYYGFGTLEAKVYIRNELCNIYDTVYSPIHDYYYDKESDPANFIYKIPEKKENGKYEISCKVHRGRNALYYRGQFFDYQSKTINFEKYYYAIVGEINICSGEISDYYYNFDGYNKLIWQITNGTILTYNSDSTEITVQWGEKGEGLVSLEMFKDGETKQLELSVTINPIPEKPVITQVDDKLVSSSSFVYQWYFNNELIEGAIDSIFEPQESGYYSVIVKNINGCASEMSEHIYFDKTIDVGEPKANIGLFDIIPNPASEFIEITTINLRVNPWVAEQFDIQIYNVFGEKMFAVGAHCNVPIRIDVSQFPNGIYFLRIGNEIQKFVVI